MTDTTAIINAAQTLLDACIQDFGNPDDFPGDDGAVALGAKGDCAVSFKHLRALRDALAAQPSAGAQGEAVALAFGFGRFVVDTGCYQEKPAVFICPVEQPGEIGASARHLGHDRHTLLPGERVLTFPTVDQAKSVADALVGSPATPTQPDTGCKTCGGRGHTEHEGGDSTQSIVEYEACPTCTAQPDTGDVAALRKGVAALQDLLTATKINCDGEPESVAFASGVIEAYETFRLAALSKPNAQGREG